MRMRKLVVTTTMTFAVILGYAGDSAPFVVDNVPLLPFGESVVLPWNAEWIGGDTNATVVIMDNGTEVKRTTGAGEFTYMPAEIGRHDLTYTTLIGDVVQDETYTATFYAKWKYKVVDGGVVITATTQKSGDVTIPDVLNGYPVKGIANDVFKGCDDLASVTVPGSVTDIGTRAFIENRNLHKIVLPVWLRGLIDESTFSDNAEDFEVVYDDSIGIYVNAKDLNFTEPEYCLWSGDMNTSHDGTASARLKGMGQDSESSIELQLDSPGRLSFWWKASSESDGNNVFDYACLSIDGVPQGTLNKENYSLKGVAIGGKTDWRHIVIDVVGKGRHVIRWTYAKDEIDEGDTGDDCVWLDEVEFTPLAYLSFDIAGGIGTAPAEISELEGEVVTLPAQSGFVWEDHVFNGWSDGRATYAAGAQYVMSATNVILTAQWIAKRFLTFALDGGEGRIPVTIKDVPGADITLPSAKGISRAKYVFVGWSDGSVTHDAGSKYRVTDASVEFKAVWQRKEAHVSIVSDDVVNGGTVDTAGATISMSACSNPSVGTPAIYYTLDGTEPTTGSTRYEEPFFVDVLGDVTVKALAVLDGCFDGEATFSFTRLPYSLRECVAMEGVNVAVGGAAPWFRVTGEGAHDGKAALRSGAIGDGESSCVEMQVRGEAEVSFWWKISSQNKVRTDKHDYLAFSVDGEEVLTLGGGLIDWTNATYAVTGSGRHSLRWTYSKDGADASNDDCAWVDDVVWSPTGKLCAVSFDANGGEVSECERKVREGSSVGDLPQPQRYCYDFDGWFAAADGGDAISSETEVTDNVIYYAHWKVRQYTVMFDANGGTGGKTVVQDYGTALSAPMVSREGYTFAGWSPAVPATVPAGGATYMAQWKVNRYAVSFDANGGTVSPTTRQVNYNAAIGDLPTPTRTGHTFTGWFTAATGGTQITASTIVKSSVTYYAHWSIYTICFHRSDASDEKTAAREFTYGVSTNLPTLASLGWARRGFDFKGWATSAANAAAGKVWKTDGAAVATPVAIGQTLDVYAVWKLKGDSYAIRFIRNDGAGTWRTVGFKHGEKTRLPSLANGLGWARRGYAFKGWALTTADAAAGKVWKGDWAYVSTPFAKGTTHDVYAVWELKPGYYQIRFNKNDGTGKWRELGYEYGKKTRLPTCGNGLGWTREGYVFAGWALGAANAAAGVKWKDDWAYVATPTTAGKTISIYALWRPVAKSLAATADSVARVVSQSARVPAQTAESPVACGASTYPVVDDAGVCGTLAVEADGRGALTFVDGLTYDAEPLGNGVWWCAELSLGVRLDATARTATLFE